MGDRPGFPGCPEHCPGFPSEAAPLKGRTDRTDWTDWLFTPTGSTTPSTVTPAVGKPPSFENFDFNPNA